MSTTPTPLDPTTCTPAPAGDPMQHTDPGTPEITVAPQEAAAAEEQPSEKKEPAEPLTGLDLAAATPLLSDEPQWKFEHLSRLQDIGELKKVYTDIYTSHYQAYKRDGRLYGVFATHQMTAMRNTKTGEVSGMLLDFDRLETDPFLCELRPYESKPCFGWKAMDYPHEVGPLTKRYYRHDAESLFYVWLAHASMLRFPGISPPSSCTSWPQKKHDWFWAEPDDFDDFAMDSEPVKETWVALWRLFGDAYFLSRQDPQDETLSGQFSVEKLMEAIGVDAETLASTVADEEGSEKEFVSDSDSVP